MLNISVIPTLRSLLPRLPSFSMSMLTSVLFLDSCTTSSFYKVRANVDQAHYTHDCGQCNVIFCLFEGGICGVTCQRNDNVLISY